MKPVIFGVSGVVLILLLIGAGLSCAPVSEQAPSPISEMEKQKIQEWIKQNDLNKYGDHQNTFYAGGNPLFNEGTGETIDLYEYILRKHPDRPWLK